VKESLDQLEDSLQYSSISVQIPDAKVFIKDMRNLVQDLIESIKEITSKKQWERVNSLSENVTKVKNDFHSHEVFCKFSKARFLYGVHSVLTEGKIIDLSIKSEVCKLLQKEKETMVSI
jgi:hypothetical protein